jgi:putative ABC transport system substrate-binding protein
LIRSRVDLIITGGHITTLAAARATSKIPIVFSNMLQFAIEQGLIESFARPGRNVTGATTDSSDAAGKSAQYLRQLVPSARRLAAVTTHLWMKVERVSGGVVDIQQDRRERWRDAGFEFQEFFYRADGDLAREFAEMDHWRPDAIAVSPFAIQDALEIVELARRRKLPSLFPWRQPVEAGGLLSYGPAFISAAQLGRAAASYIDRILRGADPATLPVEMPTRWELVINAKTADALGLTIPLALQVGAEIVR